MNYTDLKAATEAWVDRPIEDPVFRNIVELMTGAMNQLLRTSRQSRYVIAVANPGQESFAVPDDYLAVRKVSINGGEASYLTPGQFINERIEYECEYAYAVIGRGIYVKPELLEDMQLGIDYYAEVPILTDEVNTRAFADAYPELYLNGAQAWAYNFFRNYAMEDKHRTIFNNLLGIIMDQDKEDLWSAGPNQIRAG